MTTYATPPLPPHIQISFDSTWKVCPTCWRIANNTPNYCGRCGTGLSTYISYQLADIGRIWGICFCSSCSGFYTSYLHTCPVCNIPLYTVIQPEANRQNSTPHTPTREVEDCPGCSDALARGTAFCATCGKLLRLVRSYGSQRPMLDIKMRTGVHASHVNIALLVDSGASYNLFHGSWANLLGVTLTSTNTLTFSGIAPNATVTGYLGTVQLGFDEKFYDTPVYFSFDLPPTCDSMLGKHGFFDRFIVEIDDGQKSLTIREADVLTPRKYECCPHCQSNAENTSNYCYVCGASLFASATQHGFLTFPGLSTYRSI